MIVITFETSESRVFLVVWPIANLLRTRVSSKIEGHLLVPTKQSIAPRLCTRSMPDGSDLEYCLFLIT